MKVLKIDISDFRFTNCKGANIEYISDTKIIGNGWHCEIAPSGTITCYSRQFFNNTWNYLKYTLKKNGYVVVVLQLNNERKVLKRGFVIPKDEKLTGSLYLTDGDLCKRQISFKYQII